MTFRISRRVLLALVLILVAGSAVVIWAVTRHSSESSAPSAQGSKSAASTAGLSESIPRPRFAQALHRDYHALRIWYAHLSNGPAPDAIVTSTGPVNDYGLHPADLQVLSWDQIARRWYVTFDAQKVSQPTNDAPDTSNSGVISPELSESDEPKRLLDPKAGGNVTQVSLVRFAPEVGTDLVYASEMSYGGSGVPSSLVVVNFKGEGASVGGGTNIAYSWSGDGGVKYKVVGSAPRQSLTATAQYWAPADAHCCPVRTYNFTIGQAGHGPDAGIRTLTDQRPWLGLFVTPLHGASSNSAIRVVGVVPGSPAAAMFERGDVILELKNAPHLKTKPTSGGPKLFDQLATLNAGAKAVFSVARGPDVLTLSVKLGSLIDQSAINALSPNDYRVSTI